MEERAATPKGASKPIPELTQHQIDLFWRHVDKTPGHGPNGDCWPWATTLTVYGYGCFYIYRESDKKLVGIRAHRLAYRLVNGVDPFPQDVLHRCDFRPCCNPNHHYLGNRGINNADRHAKGRTLTGDAHPSTRISEARLAEMEIDVLSGMSYHDVAAKYGCKPRTIHRRLRNHWRRQGIAPKRSRAGMRCRAPRPLPEITEDVYERFLDRIDRTPGHGPNGDCWIWRGAKTSGYGALRVKNDTFPVHRIMFYCFYGADPLHCAILHSCDNRDCVQPEHLKIGDAIDIVEERMDRMAKGRSRSDKNRSHPNAYRTTGNYHSKLTPETRDFILANHVPGKKGNAKWISHQLCISVSLVHKTVQASRVLPEQMDA